MEMLTAKEIAELWSVTPRYVQQLAKDGKIKGAQRWGRTWMIPRTAQMPKKDTEGADAPYMPMPKKSPSLCMTDLYHTPGTANEVAISLSYNPEAAILFSAEVAYYRGEFELVHKYAGYLLESHSGFYAVAAAGRLLSLCAICEGNISLHRKARQHIYEAPWQDDEDREILSLFLALVDANVDSSPEYPEWFKKGKFGFITADSYPFIKVRYARYLYEKAREVAIGRLTLPYVNGLGLFYIIPYIVEPMIIQAMADKTLIPEIGLRIMCAIAYHDIGHDNEAIPHLDRVIELVLPDRLYMILAEYRRYFDYLLDDRLALVDPQLLKQVKAMSKQHGDGWTKIRDALNERNTVSALSVREREVAKLAAFGLSNMEIAKRMNITLASVKGLVSMALNKTGAKNRGELGSYI